jgi:serine/threonine protein kinase
VVFFLSFIFFTQQLHLRNLSNIFLKGKRSIVCHYFCLSFFLVISCFGSTDRIEKRLGAKTSACVYLLRHKETNKIFVGKRIHAAEGKEEESEKEIMLMRQVDNRYVVRVEDSYEDSLDRMIVMEYCKGGDMRGYIEEMKRSRRRATEHVCYILLIFLLFSYCFSFFFSFFSFLLLYT